MRAIFEDIARTYPKRPIWRDGTFKRHPILDKLQNLAPNAVRAALGPRGGQYIIEGSAGKGDWTHTPWIVLLDPAVTTSVESNYYVAYLLSHGCERLYLSLAQGCTTLSAAIGKSAARLELARRATVMRGRISVNASHLAELKMDLNVEPSVWRGKLYESGCILGVEYDAQNLPPEQEMIADLVEALELYGFLKREGGWADADAMLEDARDAEIPGKDLVQAKNYRQHRSIERDPGHSKLVKKLQGTRCGGCLFEMHQIYGDAARGICDAHHLTPLESLADGSVVTFDPLEDFAVLCPNCHRAIHKLGNPRDLSVLRAAIAGGVFASLCNREPGLDGPLAPKAPGGQ